MATITALIPSKLRAFDKSFSTVYEEKAIQSRGEFIQAFPIQSLENISLEDYVIGLQAATFCTFVEVITRPWGSVQGATARKFGIYFGRTKKDTTKKYRFSKKFGTSQMEAYAAVKAALRDLVWRAALPAIPFEAIDRNPLSQMFKAKILSLYFPDRFLNVCSAGHLEMLATKLRMGNSLFRSEIQHRLLDVKSADPIARDWSNPKFMAFLYATYINESDARDEQVVKPRKKSKRRVDFEEVQKIRSEIGQAAELFALKWEEQRLIGAGLGHLVFKIVDRRDRPGYGYDYLSHSAVGRSRYVEVKAVGRLPGGEGYRFFLSDNEREVSLTTDHSADYFFYLVFFDGQSRPERVIAIPADDLYRRCEIAAASYTVRFDLNTSDARSR